MSCHIPICWYAINKHSSLAKCAYIAERIENCSHFPLLNCIFSLIVFIGNTFCHFIAFLRTFTNSHNYNGHTYIYTRYFSYKSLYDGLNMWIWSKIIHQIKVFGSSFTMIMAFFVDYNVTCLWEIYISRNFFSWSLKIFIK